MPNPTQKMYSIVNTDDNSLMWRIAVAPFIKAGWTSNWDFYLYTEAETKTVPLPDKGKWVYMCGGE